jgi:hypothetical protein
MKYMTALLGLLCACTGLGEGFDEPSPTALATVPQALTRHHEGAWAMTATVTTGTHWHYIKGEVERPLSTTRGLLLIGVGKLNHELVKVNPVSWHRFGYLTDSDLCVGQAGLLNLSPPVVGLVSLFWSKGWAGPFIPPGVPLGGGAADTRLHYSLSIPKWTDGISILWQCILDDGEGGFWASDAWEWKAK